MKFARYLSDTHTPEWKKAYIDYRGLKKAIKKAAAPPSSQEPNSSGSPPSNNSDDGRNSSHSSTSSALELPSDRLKSAATDEQSPPSAPSLRHSNARTHTLGSRTNSRSFRGRLNSLRTYDGSSPLSLRDLLPLLTPEEAEFFQKVDRELAKVDAFYLDREKELTERTALLKMQLEELKDHRKVFHDAKQSRESKFMRLSLLSSMKGKQKAMAIHSMASSDSNNLNGGPSLQLPAHRVSRASLEDIESISTPSLRPGSYLGAKEKLRKAIVEQYRLLEMLHNYRVLNLTGFRKALKKFEKVTRIPSQEVYTNEKINPSAIGSSKTVNDMMATIQTLFAINFTQGNRKRAMRMLRPVSHYKSHHFSTFRSGFYIGLALPALVSGIFNSFQQDIRDAIGPWDALLFIYSVLLVPVLLGLAIGLNNLVYAHFRINYIFIFELDPQTRLDYREYFEVPSLLFFTLCYAFWLSFSNISGVSPTVWPLVWLVFVALLLFHPLPFVSRPSRYWFVRRLGLLFLSGTRPVEFADFWLGDQLTSMVFVLSNLYLIPCVYATTFKPIMESSPDATGLDPSSDWSKCGSSSPNWPASFVLATLPFIFRGIQSVRRYLDTGLFTHLINGGKYLAGFIAYLLYFLWRHKGGPNYTGPVFVLWCTLATFYSLYALAWDLLMDWSVLQPHAKFWMLRDELLFEDHTIIYYVAIATNTVLRFSWIIYIPTSPKLASLLTFVAALLEVLRRFQWNFFRLENEHLGNMDQYRVSKEVPLPYSFDFQPEKYGSDEDDEDETRSDELRHA